MTEKEAKNEAVKNPPKVGESIMLSTNLVLTAIRRCYSKTSTVTMLRTTQGHLRLWKGMRANE
jgi:hypothetical protein